MENKMINTQEIIINEILIPSLRMLYKIDFDNIKNGVSERNICARLSLHIENIMRKYDELNDTCFFHDYYADVEYNRMGNGELKRYENSKHRPQYMVSDLLIQSRGPKPNLLAVEMKRKGNKKNVQEDKERLMSIVTSSSPNSLAQCVYDTLIGAFIEYSSQGAQIEIFENVEGKGESTKKISMQFPSIFIMETEY